MMINCLCIRTKNTIDHRRYLVNTLFKLNCINILVVQIMLVEDDGMITCEYDGGFSKGENNRRFSDTETIAITPWKVYRAAKYFNNICITTEVVRMPLLVKKLSIIAPLNPYSFKKKAIERNLYRFAGVMAKLGCWRTLKKVLNHWLRLIIYKFFSCSPNITYV